MQGFREYSKPYRHYRIVVECHIFCHSSSETHGNDFENIPVFFWYASTCFHLPRLLTDWPYFRANNYVFVELLNWDILLCATIWDTTRERMAAGTISATWRQLREAGCVLSTRPARFALPFSLLANVPYKRNTPCCIHRPPCSVVLEWHYMWASVLHIHRLHEHCFYQNTCIRALCSAFLMESSFIAVHMRCHLWLKSFYDVDYIFVRAVPEMLDRKTSENLHLLPTFLAVDWF